MEFNDDTCEPPRPRSSSWQIRAVLFGPDAPSTRTTSRRHVRLGIAPSDTVHKQVNFGSDGEPILSVEHTPKSSAKFGRGFVRRQVDNPAKGLHDILHHYAADTNDIVDDRHRSMHTGTATSTQLHPLEPRQATLRAHSVAACPRTRTSNTFESTEIMWQRKTSSPVRSPGRGIGIGSFPGIQRLDDPGPMTQSEHTIRMRNTQARYFTDAETWRTKSNITLPEDGVAGRPCAYSTLAIGTHRLDFKHNSLPSSGVRDAMEVAEYMYPVTAHQNYEKYTEAQQVDRVPIAPLLSLAASRRLAGPFPLVASRMEYRDNKAHQTIKHFYWDAPAEDSAPYETVPDPIKRQEREEQRLRATNATKFETFMGRKMKTASGPPLLVTRTHAPSNKTQRVELPRCRATEINEVRALP